jgi:hypothetical protein
MENGLQEQVFGHLREMWPCGSITVHYAGDSNGRIEYDSLLPSTDHVVYLNSQIISPSLKGRVKARSLRVHSPLRYFINSNVSPYSNLPIQLGFRHTELTKPLMVAQGLSRNPWRELRLSPTIVSITSDSPFCVMPTRA